MDEILEQIANARLAACSRCATPCFCSDCITAVAFLVQGPLPGSRGRGPGQHQWFLHDDKILDPTAGQFTRLCCEHDDPGAAHRRTLNLLTEHELRTGGFYDAVVSGVFTIPLHERFRAIVAQRLGLARPTTRPSLGSFELNL